MAKRVDQLLPGLATGDAVSQEARVIRELLLQAGYESRMFVDPEHVAPDVSVDWIPAAEYSSMPGDVLIYHYSISSPADEIFLSARAVRVMLYHNITPGHWFRGYDDRVAELLEDARRNLKRVAASADAVWADSEFNASELRASGRPDTRVFRFLFERSRFEQPRDEDMFRRYDPSMTNLLFVGRIAPNKCIEDLIAAFAWYHAHLNPDSRLIIAGSERSCPRYYAMLRMYMAELGLRHVCFERYVSDAGLGTLYQLADLVVIASRHEGFCLPVVEAMYCGVPVVARSAAAIPETMGSAGVLFDELDPPELAALWDRILNDRMLRREILDSQNRRLSEFLERDAVREIRELLGEIL